MAQQVKIRKDEISEQPEASKNGSQTIDMSQVILARNASRPIVGRHKDDPYVAEVWDRIIASRHSDTVAETSEE